MISGIISWSILSYDFIGNLYRIHNTIQDYTGSIKILILRCWK